MSTTPRTLAVLVLGAGMALTPVTASAEQARYSDPRGDSSSPATDITAVRVVHDHDRISATVTIPRLRPGRLSGTELLIRTPGHRRVYAVTVLRDRHGRVREKSLSWRPLDDPVEPTRLPCHGIRTSLHDHSTVVSVAASCLTRTRAGQAVQGKVRTTDGTVGLQGAYFDDQTRFSRWLARGAGTGSAARGRVVSRTGLVVRGLPTTLSARRGRLAPGEVFPVACKVLGSVVFRNDDEDAARSNEWYRLAGGPPRWVSALYVEDVGRAPAYCGTSRTYQGRVTTRTLVRREAPTTRAAAHGAATRGSTVRILCKLHAQDVAGNDLWYNLPQGLWVAARYVADVGPAPASCTG